jgi:sigma-B regulation protein RsbU (phosphoserine phosphatase)
LFAYFPRQRVGERASGGAASRPDSEFQAPVRVSTFTFRRIAIFFRRATAVDKVAGTLVILGAIERILHFLGVNVSFSGLLLFVAFLAVVYLLVRLIPIVRARMMWRLRNRLIIAYVFIAVVPLVLILGMVGIAAYGLYLQLGAHILHDDLQDRISTIQAETEAIAGAIELEALQGTSPSEDAVLQRPNVARVISLARNEWPELRVFPNRGEFLVKAHGGKDFGGIVEFENKIWIAAATCKSERTEPFCILAGTPLNSAFLDGLSSEIGPIEVIPLRADAGGASSTGAKTATFNGRVFVASEQIRSRRRTLSPAANPFDIQVNGASTIELNHTGPDQNSDPSALLASFSVRPSTMNGHLFSSVGDVGPLLLIALAVAGVIFLLLEIAALATGIVLTRTITTAIGDLYEATLFVRRGDFGKRVRVQHRDQLGALGESFNEMTSSISELIDEQGKRQKLENEIEIARQVQSQLFPQTLPQLPGLELAAICRPARSVSGDYYDFIRTGPNCVGIALADISGKGIFASLLMASLQAALRSQATLDSTCGTAELVARLNRHLFRNTSDDRYATFFYGVYDGDAKTFTYTNAGHLAPFFIHGGKVEELSEGGTVVGLFEDFPYTQRTIHVDPGSLFVLFSDGLTEPENVYGEEFGNNRLREEVLRNRNAPPQKLAETLIAAAELWAGSPEQADDMTVVVARMG